MNSGGTGDRRSGSVRVKKRVGGMFLVLGLLVPGVAASGPAVAQSPEPSRTVIDEALERLTALDSYRVESTATSSSAPGRTFGTEATVVLQPAFAVRTAMLADDEPAYVSVTVGDTAWTSYA